MKNEKRKKKEKKKKKKKKINNNKKYSFQVNFVLLFLLMVEILSFHELDILKKKKERKKERRDLENKFIILKQKIKIKILVIGGK